jgi:hypothetical protein
VSEARVKISTAQRSGSARDATRAVPAVEDCQAEPSVGIGQARQEEQGGGEDHQQLARVSRAGTTARVGKHKKGPLVEVVAGGAKVVTASGLDLVEQLARNGLPQNLIARELGLTPPTWRALKRRQPEVLEAFQLGREGEEKELVDILLAKARRGELVPLLFALKSRHGYRDQGGLPEAPTTNIAILQLPAPLSMEEFRKVSAAWREERSE